MFLSLDVLRSSLAYLNQDTNISLKNCTSLNLSSSNCRPLNSDIHLLYHLSIIWTHSQHYVWVYFVYAVSTTVMPSIPTLNSCILKELWNKYLLVFQSFTFTWDKHANMQHVTCLFSYLAIYQCLLQFIWHVYNGYVVLFTHCQAMDQAGLINIMLVITWILASKISFPANKSII